MEIDVISKGEVERIAFRTVCDYLEHEDWQIEKGSIVQNIKDLTEKIDSHAKSLHNMFEAINAISRMLGQHKMLLDTHKELIDDLTKRTKVLEESCQQMKK